MIPSGTSNTHTNSHTSGMILIAPGTSISVAEVKALATTLQQSQILIVDGIRNAFERLSNSIDPLIFKNFHEAIKKIDLDLRRFKIKDLKNSRLISKNIVNWIMPADPILKRRRKNNRRMFCKRGFYSFTFQEAINYLVLILI